MTAPEEPPAVADALAVLSAASHAIEATNAEFSAVFAKFTAYIVARGIAGLAFDVPLTSGDRRIKIELVE